MFEPQTVGARLGTQQGMILRALLKKPDYIAQW